MDRRWQKGGKGRYETLESIGQLSARIPILENSLKLCDNADFYATYSNLHSKGRKVEVATNLEQGFSFFLAEPAVEPSKTSKKDAAKSKMIDSTRTAQTEVIYAHASSSL